MIMRLECCDRDIDVYCVLLACVSVGIRVDILAGLIVRDDTLGGSRLLLLFLYCLIQVYLSRIDPTITIIIGTRTILFSAF